MAAVDAPPRSLLLHPILFGLDFVGEFGVVSNELDYFTYFRQFTFEGIYFSIYSPIRILQLQAIVF